MNQPALNTNVKDGSTDISVFRAEVLVFNKKIEVWHILNPEVFNVMIIKFNAAHPKLQDDGNVKDKIINFFNKKFKMRVVFKSKEAFTRKLTDTTYKAMKKRLAPDGN